MENTTTLEMLEEDSEIKYSAKIKVIGIGGGGTNAVNSMVDDKSDLIEYWVMNTDSQALQASRCMNKLVLGKNITRGLGAGGLPSQGRMAAEDSIEDINTIVKGADLIFLACGEGGGTGTGAAPVVAKAAKDAGALVLAIVTRPFNFEGKKRSTNALEGINNLKNVVDALIVVSNDNLLFQNGSMSCVNAFVASDQILASAVKTVTDTILVHGLINLDFADVKILLSGKGLALIGIGSGTGPNKAEDAAANALNSPILETSISGSKSMLVNIKVDTKTTLEEVQRAISKINELATGKDNNEVDLIFGIMYDEELKDEMVISVIATDFDKDKDLLSKPLERKVVLPEKKVENIAPAEENKAQEDSILPDYLSQIFAKRKSREEQKKGMVQDDDEEMTTLQPDSTIYR